MPATFPQRFVTCTSVGKDHRAYAKTYLGHLLVGASSLPIFRTLASGGANDDGCWLPDLTALASTFFWMDLSHCIICCGGTPAVITP